VSIISAHAVENKRGRSDAAFFSAADGIGVAV
jgi:hypothetical protein